MKFLISTITLFLLFTPSTTAADLAKGKDALEREDFRTAFQELEPLAKQGNDFAQNALGVMYDFGLGAPEDDTKAVYWYKKAAEQGNDTSQNNLGLSYDYGEGVAEDDTKAAYWYKKAAEQGNGSAQYNLGRMYANGNGVPEDYAEAAYWY